MPLQIKDILNATGGELIAGSPDVEITGFSTDSRTISPGNLFIALQGEKHDGYSFLGEALGKGAAGAVISKRLQKKNTVTKSEIVIRVKDTLRGLGDIAKVYREEFSKAAAIAVTGSNGKTTTKEILRWLLSEEFNVVASKASFNNFVGVPLTLFEINKNTNAVVLEMETNMLGGIRRLCEIARPAFGIVTNIGDTHLEHLETKEEVYKEKAELIESLPHDGFAVLNYDDPYAVRMKELGSKKVISYGIQNKADFTASEIISSIQLRTVSGIQDAFLAFTLNKKYKIRLNTIFYKNIYNALAAIVISNYAFGMNMKTINARLRDFRFPPMRMEVIISDEIGVINDSYNANPQSMSEALLTLNKLRIYGRRIAVLGDMYELGEKSSAFHLQIGRLCATLKVDILITVGSSACFIAKGAEEAGISKKSIFVCDNNLEAVADLLSNLLRPKDIVLVKGSRKMKLEELVYMLTHR